MKRLHSVIFALVICLMPALAQAKCEGRFANPITDVCWSCIFPITVGGFTVMKGNDPVDTPNPAGSICFCMDVFPVPRPGINIGFWEPAHYVDVTHKPFCFVGLGGFEIDMGDLLGTGTTANHDSGTTSSYYYTHWYTYPALAWLDIITTALCFGKKGDGKDIDIPYISEFDPTWKSDALAMLVNPEVVLFANPIAQATCAADCLVASTGFVATDALFWCAGCQGSMYPLSGNNTAHISNLQSSTLFVQRTAYKMHRLGSLGASMGDQAMCLTPGTLPEMPIMKKSQYKTQMAFPIAANASQSKFACNPFGRSTVFWETGKSFPTKGEDFGYFVWRKRNCCAL